MNFLSGHTDLAFFAFVTGGLSIFVITMIAFIESFKSDYFKEKFLEIQAKNKANALFKKIYQDDLKSFANLLDEITFPIWQRDKNLKIVYCNKKYCEIVNEVRENIILGNTDNHLFTDSNEFADKALNSGMAQVAERNIIINGNNVLSQVVEIPVNDRKGFLSKNGTVGFALNFNELQTTRDRLKGNVELQKRLLDSLASAVVIFGPDRKMVYFNQAYVNLFKMDKNWLEGRPDIVEILDILREKRKLPEQADFLTFKKSYISMFSNLISKKEEFYYLPDGRVLRVIIIPYQQSGLLFYYEDLTGQVSLERSYNTLVGVQKQTLDNLNEAVVVFAEDGTVELFNPAYENIWQHNNEFLESQPHVKDMLEEEKSLHKFLDWNEYVDDFLVELSKRNVVERKISRRDGKTLIQQFTPLPDGGTLLTYFDISDKENVEKSLRAEKKAYEDASKIKTGFLKNVSYELRSPLTSIMGFSEMMIRSNDGKDPKTNEYLKAIHESSNKLKDLIDNIIEVTTLDAGYTSMDLKYNNIRELFERAKDVLEDVLKPKKLTLKVNIDTEKSEYEFDKIRILQVIKTLTYRAVAMAAEESEIKLSVIQVGDKLCFEVSEFGQPIEREDIPLVFEQFFRMASDVAQDSGISFYLAKKIIELHKGDIYASSNGEDRASFHFELLVK